MSILKDGESLELTFYSAHKIFKKKKKIERYLTKMCYYITLCSVQVSLCWVQSILAIVTPALPSKLSASSSQVGIIFLQCGHLWNINQIIKTIKMMAYFLPINRVWKKITTNEFPV